MSFGLNDEEWMYPEEGNPHFCEDCEHCKRVYSGTEWFYCELDAKLGLAGAKTPEQVLKAFADSYVDFEDDCGYCGYFDED